MDDKRRFAIDIAARGWQAVGQQELGKLKVNPFRNDVSWLLCLAGCVRYSGMGLLYAQCLSTRQDEVKPQADDIGRC